MEQAHFIHATTICRLSRDRGGADYSDAQVAVVAAGAVSLQWQRRDTWARRNDQQDAAGIGRRALQQVFNHVQAFNQRTGKKVRCYVPTHSLINYAHWCIVSPQSSLAKLDGCDGYIAQVWTGTARTPNHFRGKMKGRTFETPFLEYGAMQNLVRATGRSVWYLNDPVEDNPRYDWNDYRTN